MQICTSQVDPRIICRFWLIVSSTYTVFIKSNSTLTVAVKQLAGTIEEKL
jgi:hypothetical protein